MRYLCLVYMDERRIDGMAADEYDAIAEECRAYEAALRTRGHLLAMAPLESVRQATTVRVRNGRALIMDAPVTGAAEQLRWVFLITARDLNDAIRLASSIPSARLGIVEVRPVGAADDHPFDGPGGQDETW